MTRDEAEKIFHDEKYHMRVGGRLDMYVALGMLKLDEPKVGHSPTYKAYEAIFEYVPSLDYQSFAALINGSGIKIVEKD